MSSDMAIEVLGVSKSFPVYAKPHHRLLQMLMPGQGWYREFHALKHVDLQISRGETVGIVGRNGSGKSTLLQIICGTLSPSQGDVAVHGRVAALLELGAGFNPEFTGRENVFLNGAVLGLTRSEVDAKFDEILAFADIGEFIDQPVKTYSSGMYVRLAFSVAIHVMPDILIVDEALSVGDEAFQRKCFARIDAIRDAGATVLFVSHSASTVVELCDRAVLLDKGEVISIGPPKRVITQYQKLLYAAADKAADVRQAIVASETAVPSAPEDDAQRPALSAPEARPESYWEEGLRSESAVEYAAQGAAIQDPYMQTLDGRRVNMLVSGEQYVYSYAVQFERPAVAARFGMMIRTVTGVEVAGAASSTPQDAVTTVDGDSLVHVRFRFRCLLAPGTYFANAGVLGMVGEEESYLARIIDVLMFKVLPDAGRLATGFVDLDVVPQIRIE